MKGHRHNLILTIRWKIGEKKKKKESVTEGYPEHSSKAVIPSSTLRVDLVEEMEPEVTLEKISERVIGEEKWSRSVLEKGIV